MSGRRGRADHGSVLVLVPVGILVLLIFAAIAVDGADAMLGQRQLADALTAAASDAAAAGLDDAAFYGGGRVLLDSSTTSEVACQAMAAQGGTALHHLHLEIGVEGAVVTLRGSAEVEAVFGRAFPGMRHWTVRATATADAETARQAPAAPVRTAPLSC